MRQFVKIHPYVLRCDLVELQRTRFAPREQAVNRVLIVSPRVRISDAPNKKLFVGECRGVAGSCYEFWQIGDRIDWRYSTVESLAFSPDGNTLVAGLADGSIMLWHAATEQEVRRAEWWAQKLQEP